MHLEASAGHLPLVEICASGVGSQLESGAFGRSLGSLRDTVECQGHHLKAQEYHGRLPRPLPWVFLGHLGPNLQAPELPLSCPCAFLPQGLRDHGSLSWKPLPHRLSPSFLDRLIEASCHQSPAPSGFPSWDVRPSCSSFAGLPSVSP